MNRWQIIYPVVAMLAVGSVLGMFAMRGKRRGFISAASYSIGSDLLTTTNSLRLIRVGPQLQARLSELLGARTHVAAVLFGDESSPFGDSTACSRLVLTNDVGRGLVIRLRQAEQPGMFNVLGFRSN